MNQKKFWFENRTGFFQSLSYEDSKWLNQNFEVKRYERHQHIYTQNDPGDFICFIKTGLVKISKVTEEGRELTLMFIPPCEIFGELCVVSNAVRGTLAEAYEDSVICTVDRKIFLDFMQPRQHVAVAITKIIGDRRRKLENKIDSLFFKSANSKLISLFLELAKDFGVKDSRGTIINLKLTHREIANLIGSTRETVSFALLDLKQKQLIETDGKRIILLNNAFLQDTVNTNL